MNDSIVFSGSISFIKFEQNGYVIADFLTDDDSKVLIKGVLYGVNVGERIKINATQTYHQKYGFQLEVNHWEREIPTTEEQAIHFLSSSLVHGCGLKLATRIVNKLGSTAIQQIKDKGTEVLSGISGINQSKALAIAEAINRNFELQEIANDFLSYGIEMKSISKIYPYYKSETRSKISENPYILMKYDNTLDFYKTDEIARKMGIVAKNMLRIANATTTMLKSLCYQDGHCYMETTAVAKATLKLLNHNVEPNEYITFKELEDTIYKIAMYEEYFIIENGLMYLKSIFKSENNLAYKIAKMVNQPTLTSVNQKHSMNLLNEFQRKNGVILALNQREAVHKMFQNQLLIVTGQAGTGKTTVLKAMVNVYEKTFPHHEILIAAPTGRARKRASEVTGKVALTIHKVLNIDPISDIPEYNKDNPLPHDLVFVDEFSMVGLKLANMLFNALKPTAKLVIFGDSKQLPSVDSGYVLEDLVQAHVNHIELNEVFRQAEESQIIKNAHRINLGQCLLVDMRKDDFFYIQAETDIKIQQGIISSYKRFLQLGYKVEDIMVLSPQKKGIVGTIELNKVLQELYNPKTSNNLELISGEKTFRTGDFVINLKNNTDAGIANGDTGLVIDIRKKENKDIIVCDFEGLEVLYERSDLNNLDLAYARSVHKSQGSEAPVVIMPFTMTHRRSLVRNLFYTGLTRTKKTYVCIGTLDAINYAISNNKVVDRKTLLTKRILKLINSNKNTNLSMKGS